MEILLFLLIGLVAGWVAGEVAKDYGFGLTAEMAVGLVAALAGGYLFDYFGLNPYGFWGSVAFAGVTAAAVLLLTKLYHPAQQRV